MSDTSCLLASTRLRVSAVGRLLCAILLAVSSTLPSAQGYYDQANDFYQARGRNIVVDQFHLPLCEQRLRQPEYARKEYLSRALTDCIFILKIFPNHPRALLAAVQVCEQMKSPTCPADEFLERAIAINPAASATFVVQGIYLHRTHRYTQAIESFKQALKLEPNSINAHYDLGLAYLETKQFELANEQAQDAYALGAPLPGLRKRLELAGYWKPLQQKGAYQEIAPPASKGADQGASDAPRKSVAP